jgi:hypothetical protein
MLFNKKGLNFTTPLEHDRLIRAAYFGGRCEVFGNAYPDEQIYHFDFYAMYSQIMLENFCFGNMTLITEVSDTKAPGFYNVRVCSKIKEIPVLPFRDNTGKLLFPNGS